MRGVIVLLVDASAKKVTKTNMSSILVMAKELHNASRAVVAVLIESGIDGRESWSKCLGWATGS